MDQQLQKQLVRQLKIINFWISFYGIIMIIIMGFVLYMIIQMVMFVQDTNRRIESLKSGVTDSVNVQKQACDGTGAFSDLLRDKTDLCK